MANRQMTGQGKGESRIAIAAVPFGKKEFKYNKG
jgi:hypothetical protein